MSYDEKDLIGMDAEAEEAGAGRKSGRKRKRHRSLVNADWILPSSQFIAREEAKPKESSNFSEASERSNAYDGFIAEEASCDDDNTDNDDDDDGDEKNERRAPSEIGYHEALTQEAHRYFNMPHRPELPDDNSEDADAPVAVADADHVSGCFMCLYGNRGFDRLNQTHREEVNRILIESFNSTSLSDDEIGTQLWLYFDNIACPEMVAAAEKDGRAFRRPPWSLKEARRHVALTNHPILFLRRNIRELTAYQAKLLPHLFPEEEDEEGKAQEVIFRPAHELYLKAHDRLCALMLRDPSKMLGGKDKEITTEALTSLWRNGRDYANPANWNVEKDERGEETE